MGKLERMVPGREEMSWPGNLIEKEDLEKWQRYFSGIANVFLCAVDNGGVPLTELAGESRQIRQIEQFIDGEQFQSMLQRVSESHLEDQAVERTAWPNLLLGVTTSRLQGKPVVNWLICAVTAKAEDAEEYENSPLEGFSTVPDENHFLRLVDTLRTLTDELLADKLARRQAEQKSAKGLLARREAEEKLRRSELLREMMWIPLQMEAQEEILRQLLKMTGEFLLPGVAALYTRRKGQTQPKLVAEWEKDTASEFKPEGCADSDKSRKSAGNGGKIGWPGVLVVEKTLILSYNSTMSEGEKEELDALGLTGIIVMPGKVSGEEDFWFCLGEKDRERIWELEEIRLTGEVVRILQSVLQRYGQGKKVQRRASRGTTAPQITDPGAAAQGAAAQRAEKRKKK